MKGLGTLVNFAAVLAGGIIGMFLKNGISERLRVIVTQACGLSVIFIGAAGVLCGMLRVSDGIITSQNAMLITASLVAGGITGEIINIEKRLDSLGERLKSLVGKSGDSRFVQGFVTATLVICVGAMAIVGSLKDGISGDVSMLFIKSVLDLVIIVVLAAVYGGGVMFSAFPLLIYQGLITVFAAVLEPFMSEALISNLSCVGSVLVFGVGVNLTFGNKIRVGNLLPAFLVPVIYEIIRNFFSLL